MTPAARSLALLRSRGSLAAVVEKRVPIPGKRIRRDLFHLGDVLGVYPVRRVFLSVQATTADHVAHRLAKAKEQPERAVWIRTRGVFLVHGWSRRDGRWHVRQIAVRGDDLQIVSVAPRSRRRQKASRQQTLFGELRCVAAEQLQAATPASEGLDVGADQHAAAGSGASGPGARAGPETGAAQSAERMWEGSK